MLRSLKNCKIQMILIFILFHFSTQRLLSVIEINRHGERTPSPWKIEKKSNLTKIYNTLYGEDKKLTSNGFSQSKLLGQYMRTKYIINKKLISPDYNKEEVAIYSTPTQRTIFSANGFISGLFPDYLPIAIYNEKELANVTSNKAIPIKEDYDFDVKVVPFKVLSNEENRMFIVQKCKLNGTFLLNEENNITEYPNLFNISFSELNETLNEIEKIVNVTIDYKGNDLSKITSDLLKMMVMHWASHEGQLKLLSNNATRTIRKIVLNKIYSSRLSESKKVKLESSEFFKLILNHFLKVVQGQKSLNFLKEKKYPKYIIYSAHNENIVSLLSNLVSTNNIKIKIESALENQDDFDFLYPPYASSFIFELHRNDTNGDYSVSIIYNGKRVKTKIDEEIQNRDYSVDFISFSNFLSSLIDNDYKNLECPDERPPKNVLKERLAETEKNYLETSKIGLEFVPSLLK